MAINSNIEWTESTWNPVTGCTKISTGCLHCYAETMSKRLKAMGQPNYANGFEVTLHPDAVELPLKWKKPQTIFVNSMSDLFHEDVPLGFIREIFNIMNRAHWHRFQVLTKRPERLAEMNHLVTWSQNIWMGVSVERARYMQRIDLLRECSASIRFLSLEPLLGPLHNLNLTKIGWVIVGGESGAGARPMKPEWVMDIRDQCQTAGVPFFFKQWGGVHKKRAGRQLDGVTWSQLPMMG